MRQRAHYPSDILAGGALGITVALALWELWPPKQPPASLAGLASTAASLRQRPAPDPAGPALVALLSTFGGGLFTRSRPRPTG